MRLGVAVFLLAAAAALPSRAASLALVLAIDVSGSVSPGRYALQHDGIARAFESPQLIKTIDRLPGGIEALMLEWSDPEKIAITVGWTRITNQSTAAAFAQDVRATHRTSSGLTAIGSAMLAAGAAFDHMPEPAARRIIDISGDGSANYGEPPAAARNALVGRGITINGLAILTEEPNLDAYYRNNVIGGPAAFVVVAQGMASFAAAIQSKLVTEIAGRASPSETVAVLRARR